MQAGGSFYLYTKQPSSWLPFSFGGRSLERERAIDHRIDGLLSRKIARASGSSPGAAALDCEVGYAETASFRCDGAGLTVVYKTKEIGGELYRVKPAVFQTENEICVFYGYLSNSEDVLDLLSKSGRRSGFGCPVVGSAQDGELAAELLLHMYRGTSSKDLLIMLSELQGQYAFVVYDSHRKQAFAARDPSGRESLYYSFDDDDGLSFTNKPFEVPGGERTADWEVMPPGHFIAGKSSRLKQFALTPEQLHQREVFEAMDEPPSPLSTSPHSPNNSYGTYGTYDTVHSCAVDSRRRNSLETLNLFRISM